jgi:SM-20-related protein
MDMAVDLDRFRTAVLHADPYEFAVVLESFADDKVANQLREEFPTAGFSLSERLELAPRQNKRYRSYNYQLILDGVRDEARIAALTPLWRQVAGEVSSSAYRDALTELTGRDLFPTVMEARLVRYSPGCWIEPHTDRSDKVATHLWYFNRPWEREWLGELRVLRSAEMNDFAMRVFPDLGTSVVMVRSDRAYHAVPPVAAHCPADRMTMLVHFSTMESPR